jgi:hypothetical protein
LGEFKAKEFPPMKFTIGGVNRDFDYMKELKALDSATKLMSIFNVSEPVNASFVEMSRLSNEICGLEAFVSGSNENFGVEFSINRDVFHADQLYACVVFFHAAVGSHYFCVFFVAKGHLREVEGDRFKLDTSDISIERKFISPVNDVIEKEELFSEMKKIEEKYEKDYCVITLS